jgi:hypothetical protein
MKLFERHPRPWRIVLGAVYEVLDANDETVIYSGTYSGDGDDELNLTGEQVAELVELVNKP